MTEKKNVAIDCDFPGGNIIVAGVEGDTIRLRPDLRDTEGWWFYWYYRVRGAQGRTLRFVFEGRDPTGSRGPAVSTNGGATWTWLGREQVKDGSFSYAFPENANEVRFCFAIPYVDAHLQAFKQRIRSNPNVGTGVLCKTRKGRDVELLRAGKLDGGCRFRVLLTCRHHCCEMMASYALEGIVDAVLADTDAGRWLRQHAEFLIVPFMDKDGVEEGDQGKNRRPHDHNRDYNETSIYPAVAALRELVPQWTGKVPRVSLDLHCPYIRGGINDTVYFPGIEDPENAKQLARFSAFLKEAAQGPIPFDPANNLPFGQGWNTAKNYTQGKSCPKWLSEVPGNLLAATLEFPYATAGDAEVNPDSARAFGQAMAEALCAYLKEVSQGDTGA